ncbi:hypothetical protein B9467_005245 [Klebsiella pneumoniae]|nr:hypothetical protein B9467_005245 [Klebsiella pneumoniae]
MTLLIGSCAKSLPAKPEVIDTACGWVKPLYLTERDIIVMDSQTKRDVLAYNLAWKFNCNH